MSQFPTQSMEPSDFKPSDRAASSSQWRHQTHDGHWWSIHRCTDPDTQPGVRLSLLLSKPEMNPALSYCSISNMSVLWRWCRQRWHLPVTRCRSHSPTRFSRLTQLTKHCQTWNSGNKTNMTSRQEISGVTVVICCDLRRILPAAQLCGRFLANYNWMCDIYLILTV